MFYFIHVTINGKKAGPIAVKEEKCYDEFNAYAGMLHNLWGRCGIDSYIIEMMDNNGNNGCIQSETSPALKRD